MRNIRSFKNFKIYESSSITSHSMDAFEFDKIVSPFDTHYTNKDLEDRIRFYHHPIYPTKDIFYTILKDGEKIIAICKIANYKDLEPLQMEIAYCSIDMEYRGRGLLNVLIKELMELCKRENISLGASRWTVPGFLKLRPTVLKWSKKIGVEFRDHELKFDHPHTYNSKMINVNEMSPEELEEHQKMGRLKPKWKGIWKKIFYETGKYKIYSTQTDFDKEKIDSIFKDINSNDYRYFSNDGKIAGYIYKGDYYITEGHHRILAALKYWRKYNDYKPVDKMIVNGNFEEVNQKPQGNRRFPSKMMEKKFQ